MSEGGTDFPALLRATRKVVGLTPDVVVDRKFREQALEVAQHLLLAITTSAVPQLEPHDRTPARLARLERPLHTLAL